MEVYKIKHIPSGLYWKGGGIPNYLSYPLTHLSDNDRKVRILKMKFSKTGKSWHRIGHAKSAITYQKNDDYMWNILKECEIQKFILNLITDD